VVIPLHPRTKGILNQTCDTNLLENLTVIEPLSYLEMQRLEMGARVILTDSGSMQKESYFHGVPCITLRDETEWVETVISGWNTLVGASTEKIIKAFENRTVPIVQDHYYGDGKSADKIFQSLLN
jgi:UDP-N-acetylglucosamine 2-epimerase